MYLSCDEAKELLEGSKYTVDELKYIVSQVSGRVYGADSDTTYLLYSGASATGRSVDLVAALVKEPNVKYIGDSEVGKFIVSYEFRVALNKAINLEMFGDEFPILRTREEKDARATFFNRVMHGTDGPGDFAPRLENADSIWDAGSKNYAAHPEGKFRVVAAEKFDPLSVFMQSELEAVLGNKNVTTIDGLSREELEALWKAEGENAVAAKINAYSVAQVAASGLSETNVNEYLHRSTHLDEYLANEPAALNRLAQRLQSFEPEWRAELQAVTKALMHDAAKLDISSSGPISPSGAKLLKSLGIVGALIGFGLSAGEASAHDARGDRQGAIRIMEDWAVDAAASGVGSMIGTALAGLALGAMGAAGLTIGAPLTVVALLAAGVAGGIAGADAGMSVLERIRALFETAKQMRSPLILDLDRDGIDTLSVGDTARTHFDHDANGFAERTGWISAQDAFLVRDLNGNGRIDSGRELFGNQTHLSNGATAGNGFIALAELDLNGDGAVDAQEAATAGLMLWRDANSNGITDDGELLTLAEAGVASLLVRYTHSQRVDASGNAHRQLGFFVATDGSKVAMNDVWFAADLALTVNQQPLELSEAILALPEVAGMGRVASLRQAMARDGSGQLQGLVEQWMAADAATRSSLLDNLIFHWTGVQDADPASRWSASPVIGDSRRLLALEAWLGQPFIHESTQSQDPIATASVGLRQAFELLALTVERELLLQTDYAQLLNRPELITWDTTRQTFGIDQRALLDLLADRHAAIWAESPHAATRDLWQLGQALRELGAGGTVVIQALQAEATASGHRFGQLLNSAFNASEKTILNLHHEQTRWTYVEGGLTHIAVLGGEGNADVRADAGNDELIGGSGNDRLNGGAGDDVLHGGAGNDYLEGGAGRDTYRFKRGDGRDRINNVDTSRSGAAALNEDHDRLLLGAGLSMADARINRQGGDLTLSWSSGEVLSIEHYFSGAMYRLPIHFADGETWRFADIVSQLHYIGTDASETMTGLAGHANRIDGRGGNDTIRGGDLADVLSGGDGNDSLYGGAGDDTLHGGTGNDYLEGGTGRDLYRFNLGDGQDRITNYDGSRNEASPLDEDHDQLILGEGLSVADTRLSRQDNHLTLSWSSGDAVTLQHYFGSPTHRLAIQFAEGVTWRLPDVSSRLDYLGTDLGETMTGITGHANRIDGRGGNDTIRGGDLADVLSGGGGNDVLYGGAGDDTLHGGTGNDNLEGGTGRDLYRFNLGDGQDRITNYDGSRNEASSLDEDHDQLILGEGLSVADTRLSRQDNHLTLSWSSGDAVTLQHYFGSPTHRLAIQFAEGVTWRLPDVASRLDYLGTDLGETMTGITGHANRIDGRGGNDTVRGGDLADVLSGGDGNDALYGGAGDDTLHGGTGNDYLEGGTGRDLYRFHLGDGQDRINNYDGTRTAASLLDDDHDRLILGEGLSVAETRLSRQNNHLTLSWSSGDSVNIEHYFASPSQRLAIQFADGVTWRLPDIAPGLNYIGTGASETMTGFTHHANRIDGRGGNDTIRGGERADVLLGGDGHDALHGAAGDDILWGGAGNDQLYGGPGHDLYLFRAGDGQDRIGYTDSRDPQATDQDVLLLGAGLKAQDTVLVRQGDDLQLSWGGTDSVTVQQFFRTGQTWLDELVFADGIQWSHAEVIAAMAGQTGAARSLDLALNRTATDGTVTALLARLSSASVDPVAWVAPAVGEPVLMM